MNITYEHPYFSLLGIVAMIAWILGFYKLFKRPEIFIPVNLKGKSQRFFRGIVFISGIIGWLLISYSVMGPRSPVGISKNNIEVNDIFFVVDVSRSMLANDFKPNRLEVSKKKILEFIKFRPTDRIGLIVFSEKVFTLMPLSTDLELVKQMVSEIEVGFLGSGTNIGDAIGLAVARASNSLAKSKVIILLTDGVSNVGTLTPQQSAEEAAKKKIKIYTIAVGGNKDARLPIGNLKGPMQQYTTIPGGSYDYETLKLISKMTKGKAYIAKDEKSLRNVLGEIEKLEKREIQISAKIVYKELYWKYLFLGVVLLIGADFSRIVAMRERV